MKPVIFLLGVMVVATGSAMAADGGDGLYRIDAQTPEGLQALFKYSEEPIPVLSAHRGGAQPGFPENCIATFENTIRHAFSMLEIDLRYSKDGVIVLHHDPSLERTTTGEGPVADKTLQELKALRLKDLDGKVTEHQMPTLDEALEWARGKTVLVLDMKDVTVEAGVQKIEEHHAESYAMLMLYSFESIQKCYELNPDIMMEIMIGTRERYSGYDKTGVPWTNAVVFISHTPPEDLELLEMIHAKGASCMAGTSRNLDKTLWSGGAAQSAELEKDYRALLGKGIDIIETNLPIQVGALLYTNAGIPAAKMKYLHKP